MKNLTIEINHYEGSHRGKYRAASATLDGERLMSELDVTGVADFTEKAIKEVINRQIRKDFDTQIELTVTAPLSEGTKTVITDKYSADPVITTIQFQ